MQYGDYSLEKFTGLLKAKDRCAFEHLYDAYSAPLYGVITNQIRDAETCNEILVKVFLKIWRHIDQYDQHSACIFAWMHQLALKEIQLHQH